MTYASTADIATADSAAGNPNEEITISRIYGDVNLSDPAFRRGTGDNLQATAGY